MRDTFAPRVAQPQQVGGVSQGNQTQAGFGGVSAPRSNLPIDNRMASPMAGSAALFGGILEKVLGPEIEARMEGARLAGVTNVLRGASLEELEKSKAGFKGAYGRAAVEAGSALYAANKSTAFVTKITEDLDKYAGMSDDARRQDVLNQLGGFMTGNRDVDMLIRATTYEQLAPFEGLVAKRKYELGQQTARRNSEDHVGGSAGLFQMTMVKLAAVTAPTDEETVSAKLAGENFAAALTTPFGMDLDTAKKSFVGNVRKQIQAGNGYAVEAMLKSPVFQDLTDEEQTRILTFADSNGRKAQDRVATQFIPSLVQLHARVRRGEVNLAEYGTALKAANVAISRATGFTQDFFDYEAQMSGSKTLVNDIVSREQQLEDSAQKRAWEVEDMQREASQTTALWASGLAGTAVAEGAARAGYEQAAAQAWEAGGFQPLATNVAGGYVSTVVKGRIQTAIDLATADPSKPSAGVQDLYTKYAKMKETSPAAAFAYFGDNVAPMEAYGRARAAGSDHTEAYIQAFGPTSKLTQARAKVEGMGDKDLVEGITRELGNRAEGAFFKAGYEGRQTLTGAALGAASRVVTARLAGMSQTSNLTGENLVRAGTTAAMADGTLEWYGNTAWANTSPTKPLSAVIGATNDETGIVLNRLLDKHLRSSGLSDGAEAQDIEIARLHTEQGVNLWVRATDEDGLSRVVYISEGEMRDEVKRRRGPKTFTAGSGMSGEFDTGFQPITQK